jgi:hypothetical protein
LHTWWNEADQTLKNDQEALDQIPSKNVMHVLHPTFFNTDPPAMTQLSPADRAIHLMEETEPYRKQVFQSIWAEPCRAQCSHNKQEPARLLGITRSRHDNRLHQVEYDLMLLHNPLPIQDSCTLEEYTEKIVARVTHTILRHTSQWKIITSKPNSI